VITIANYRPKNHVDVHLTGTYLPVNKIS
jgi:hypothetical protein